VGRICVVGPLCCAQWYVSSENMHGVLAGGDFLFVGWVSRVDGLDRVIRGDPRGGGFFGSRIGRRAWVQGFPFFVVTWHASSENTTGKFFASIYYYSLHKKKDSYW
jgi:hypothetical protein